MGSSVWQLMLFCSCSGFHNDCMVGCKTTAMINLSAKISCTQNKWSEVIEGVHEINGSGPIGKWGWICTLAIMHQLGFSQLAWRINLDASSWKKTEASCKVCHCVSEQGGVISILQVCQMVVAQSDFCDSLIDLSHYMINYIVKKVWGCHTALGIHPDTALSLVFRF